jgi:phage gp46-like protein
VTDVRIKVNEFGADLEIAGGDLALDAGLETACYASVFTDARAIDGQVDSPDVDPLGYWADRRNDRWGSRLWQLERSKRTKELPDVARTTVLEGLEWMKRTGVAEKITATGSYGPRGELAVEVIIQRSLAPQWDDVWKGIDAQSYQIPGGVVRLLFR